jgi:serine/threonine protein kinase
MKLSDLVHSSSRKVSEWKTFTNNPWQILRQRAWAKGQEFFERLDVPGTASKRGTKKGVGSDDLGSERRSQGSVALAPPPVVTSRNDLASPAIAQNDPVTVTGKLELRGKRHGLYTIKRDDSSKSKEEIRLYEGKSSNGISVLVKEYRLLDLGFNDAEVKQRQSAFEDFIDLNYKIGHGPDFRLVKLLDAIVPSQSEVEANPEIQHCCYLITQTISNSMSLEDYLAKHSKMPAQLVWHVLQQVLETLCFLHDAYRVRFPSETSSTRETLVHGNLRLSSLLMRWIDPDQELRERNFFIYVTDLALWEHLFSVAPGGKIATSSQDLGSVEQDLKALGEVAYRLLRGTRDQTEVSLSDFESDPIWAMVQDESLKHFMRRLLQITPPGEQATTNSFKSAAAALDVLMNPSELQASLQSASPSVPEAEENTYQQPWVKPLALVLLILGISTGLVLFARWLLGFNNDLPVRQPSSLSPTSEPSFIKDVDISEPLTYLVEQGGTWNYALQNTFINEEMKRTTFVDELKERANGRLSITSSGIVTPGALPLSDRETIFKKLLNNEASVALMRINTDVDQKGLQADAVAYDGLVIFVAFSDANNPRNVPKKLEGKITLDELRQLYMGEKQEWNGYPVRLFYPDESATSVVFEELLMRNDEERENYRRTKQNNQNTLAPNVAKNIYAQIQNHFENAAQFSGEEEIGIGFARLSQSYGQCSVYPLAIAHDSRQPAVQSLVQVRDGEAISPETDLCNKGSYQVNISALKSEAYPLAYKLGVVSAKDSEIGNRFAEILNTVEGQYLMSQVGLFPEMATQEISRNLWRNDK